MSIETRIETLDHKYHLLEDKIHDAYVHHLPTASLKKQRLKIRDEIERLQFSDNKTHNAA